LLRTGRVAAPVLLLLVPWVLEDNIIALTAVGRGVACWIGVLGVADAVQGVSRGTKTALSYWGMVAAHLGLAVTITGIAVSQTYMVGPDVRLRAGHRVATPDYRLTLLVVPDLTVPTRPPRGAVLGRAAPSAPSAGW
ncbi:cytochrome c-type biogenesis CcmF C-terminal domain-containing protein, partial [Salmonella enterica]|uniref:cytochrome c-type biogenesis CcmF C-terminal domain-containing protein n=1 Tax=Salmonella enterica TaxID=28901 RepID=UPI00398C2843